MSCGYPWPPRHDTKSGLSLQKMVEFLVDEGAFDAYFKEKEHNMRNVLSSEHRKEIQNGKI